LFLAIVETMQLSDCKASVCVQRKCSLNLRRSCRGNAACRVPCSLLKVEEDVDDEACELVSGLELSIVEGDDSIIAYLLNAVKNNNGTGILLV
jgi:carboxymethylenebutenolidase